MEYTISYWNNKNIHYASLCTITGHHIVNDKGYNATCTEKGKTDGSHCEYCNVVFQEQKTIPETGHSFTKYTTLTDGNLITKVYECDNGCQTKRKETHYQYNTKTNSKFLHFKEINCKKNTKRITGILSHNKIKVSIKIGKKDWENAKVSGKKFSLKTVTLKKGMKIAIRIEKKGFITATRKIIVK